MKVLESVSLGCLFFVAVILGHSLSQTISSPSAQPAESLPDNFIEFRSAPDRVVDGSVVRVRYRCSRPCQLAVEVVVSTLKKTDFVVFRKKWISRLGVYWISRVVLKLPPSILYKQDFFNRRVLDPQRVAVRAWLDHHDNSSEPKTYRSSFMWAYKVLQTTPLSERPVKPPTECPSWSAHLMWQMRRNRIHQCQHESDIVDMLTFPLASTGEHFGVIRKFHPFIDRSLERSRRHAVTKPRFTLSVWIYLLEWCHMRVCGIIHHINRENSFDSILMLLTDTGDVVIQARVTSGEDDAFTALVVLPLRKWIRLDCYVQDSKVLLDVKWDDKSRRIHYRYKQPVHFDDTDGYFVIGGGRYMQGIHGYYGPVRYHRFGTEEVNNPLQPSSTLKMLDKTHQECQEVKEFTKAFLQEVTMTKPTPREKRGTTPFIRPWGQAAEKTCKQTWTLEKQLQYSNLFHFLQTNEENIRTGFLGMKKLGAALFESSVKTVFAKNQTNNTITLNSTSLLKEASCLGNHRASLLLATIHLSGLGNSVDQQQGHVYSLIGAAGDNRFALMHAGYKHSQGIDGFPKDLDLAYSYYSNTGFQSSIDVSRLYESKQSVIQHIYLNNPEDLNQLSHQKNDGFQYEKFKAESGDVQAQRNLAVMLYRGENGVSKDTDSAVKWFERSAMQMKDPEALYDYSIILMKGEGVKKNKTKGFKLMQKAAEMGSIRALNALGWYYWNILNDDKNAVKYFEQAAQQGNEDGMFNLGIYYLTGTHPDKPWKNETAAFQHFLGASWYGHIAGSVEAARYYSTGNLKGVSRDVERAVMMLKKVCDQNGHLGFMIGEALQAYLQSSWQEALVKYMLAAETGLGLAQSNAAHLCEELNLSPDCQWRYHNYSILNYDPHPATLLKMGDHYYYHPLSITRADSLSLVGRAVSMYSRAAVAGSPQGMFNLVVLVKEGHTLPPDTYNFFSVSRYDELHVVVEKILKRCVEAEHEDAVTPCSLALLGVQMGKALSRMTQSGAQLILAYASLLSALVITVIMPLQSCLRQRISSQHVRERTSPVSQEGVSIIREQNGIMGERFTAAGILGFIALKGEQCLRQAGDFMVTVSGVCLCVFWTTLLYYLL